MHLFPHLHEDLFLFLPPAWDSQGNLKSLGLIVSTVWWQEGKAGTNVCLDYLFSCQVSFRNGWPPSYDSPRSRVPLFHTKMAALWQGQLLRKACKKIQLSLSPSRYKSLNSDWILLLMANAACAWHLEAWSHISPFHSFAKEISQLYKFQTNSVKCTAVTQTRMQMVSSSPCSDESSRAHSRILWLRTSQSDNPMLFWKRRGLWAGGGGGRRQAEWGYRSF